MSTNRDRADDRSSTSRLVDSMDQMVRLPLEMTGATWDLMKEGMERMTHTSGLRSRRSDRTSSDERTSGSSEPRDDQDLSGDDLKYVKWSILFTRPGFECVLEPQHEELVNYSADGASFAALKIAKFLDRARHGRVPKPEAWEDTYPPPHVSNASGRKVETTSVTPARTADESGTSSSSTERGWRIPAEDQKYITFLYNVERRLAKQEQEVERVTIERGVTTKVI